MNDVKDESEEMGFLLQNSDQNRENLIPSQNYYQTSQKNANSSMWDRLLAVLIFIQQGMMMGYFLQPFYSMGVVVFERTGSFLMLAILGLSGVFWTFRWIIIPQSLKSGPNQAEKAYFYYMGSKKSYIVPILILTGFLMAFYALLVDFLLENEFIWAILIFQSVLVQLTACIDVLLT